MTVLAIVPGAESGWSLVSDRGVVIACGASPADEVGEVVDGLVRLSHRNGADVRGVLQRPAALDVASEFARRLARRWLDTFDVDHVEVARHDWQRSRASRDFTYPVLWDGAPLGQGARDAIAVAAYYLHPGPQLRKLKAGAWTPWRAA